MKFQDGNMLVDLDFAMVSGSFLCKVYALVVAVLLSFKILHWNVINTKTNMLFVLFLLSLPFCLSYGCAGI